MYHTKTFDGKEDTQDDDYVIVSFQTNHHYHGKPTRWRYR